MRETLGVGVLGVGTVGGGVVDLLRDEAELIAERAGCRIEIRGVSARDPARQRPVDISALPWFDDPRALAGADGIDCLVEATGQDGDPVLAALVEALRLGRHVVSANKALLARHGVALAIRAEEAGAALAFEAAVAGGIPILKSLGEGLAGNRILGIHGVLNGTCNFILTRMEEEGASYGEALAEAQRLGYAEADPAMDVEGTDAAQKLALLAALAFGVEVDFDGVAVTGLDQVDAIDVEHARDLGFRIRLLAVARLTGSGLEQRVQPCLVPADSTLGALTGVTNAVAIEGAAVGRTVFVGAGAGAGPTASAIVADLVDIARGARRPAFGVAAHSLVRPVRQPREDRRAPYYLRLRLEDRPGALASVAGVLGNAGVSIDRLRQYAGEAGGATVLIVTHPTLRKRLDEAVAAIEALNVSLNRPAILRIEFV